MELSARSQLFPCLLLFGRMCFHVLSEGAWVGVAFCTSWNLTSIRFSVKMRPLVLGTVTGVAESLLAARVLAQVWLLPRVAPQMNLEVLKS